MMLTADEVAVVLIWLKYVSPLLLTTEFDSSFVLIKLMINWIDVKIILYG